MTKNDIRIMQLPQDKKPSPAEKVPVGKPERVLPVIFAQNRKERRALGRIDPNRRGRILGRNKCTPHPFASRFDEVYRELAAAKKTNPIKSNVIPFKERT